MHKLQFTLALLKPDVAVNPVACQWIIQKILDKNLSVVSEKVLHWKLRDSEKFYEQHQGKFFHQRLVEYTSCAPIIALLLAGHNAIQSWRQTMGPTKTFQAKILHPYTIRGEFGLSDTRNSSHGSDSEPSLNEEIQLIFPEFDFQKWLKNGCQEIKPFDYRAIPFFRDPSRDRISRRFGVAETWTTYYTSKNNMEWFVSYPELRNSILPLIQKVTGHREEGNSIFTVVDIGCGSSMVGPHIALDLGNSTEIYCMDFAIEGLKSLQQRVNRNRKFENLKNCFFVHHDITLPLPFNLHKVDAIIDKGTTDAVIRQKGGLQFAHRALSNMLKSLKKNGILIQITDEPPEVHMDILQEVVTTISDCSFHISCKELYSSTANQNFEYFVYTVTKS